MKGMRTLMALVTVALVLGGCATQVERLEPDTVRDLSGHWNDTDSRLVSEAMIPDMLAQPWLGDFRGKHDRRPTVIVGEIRNRSDEHIDMETFVNDIAREMINSGDIVFVASKEERSAIRAERQDQDLNAREDTRKPMGRELGADFMLTGVVSSIDDSEGRRSVRYYQIDLTLISLADNRKVWIGQKKIKKFVTQAGLRL